MIFGSIQLRGEIFWGLCDVAKVDITITAYHHTAFLAIFYVIFLFLDDGESHLTHLWAIYYLTYKIVFYNVLLDYSMLLASVAPTRDAAVRFDVDPIPGQTESLHIIAKNKIKDFWVIIKYLHSRLINYYYL